MPLELSYVTGDKQVALIEESIGVYFDGVAARYPEREALVVVHQNIRWSYRQFKEKVEALAGNLLEAGLCPGDRVGIWAQNCSEWVLTQFATAKLGLILVTINPAYRRSELEYALKKAQCRALILAPRFKTSDYLAILQSVVPDIATAVPGALNLSLLPELKIVVRMGAEPTPGMLNFDRLLDAPSAAALQRMAAIQASVRCDDPVNIQFTSGTTGAPKGATLTHRNILNNGFFVGEAMRLTAADKLCIPVPLYHCFGMVLGNLACVTHGAAMVYPGEGFDPKAVLEAVQQERCSGLHGVPTMFIAVLEHPEFARYDLSSLRTGIMAGSPCPVEVMRRVLDDMSMREVTIAYGMTETSPVSFQSSVDDPIELRVSTVGRIHPHVEVKIIDAAGETVARGEKGELLTRGYSVMSRYWNDPEKTKEAIDEAGWMHTEDIAVIDANGYCKIVGRAKDMVIRGGENIYPREVEEFLYTHPKVQDVQCVGLPDEKYGEELCACIILKPGMTADAEEIKAYCRNEIAHYKVPRYIRFVDSFPMTVTGKVQKYLLRNSVAAEIGLKHD